MAGAHGFVFVLDEELSEGSLVALIVKTPSGKTVQVWTEVELVGRMAVLRQFAIYGVDAAAGEIGPNLLRRLARAAMEEFDVDRIRIEEARRTTGAGPGRTVRAIEFRRRDGAADPDAAQLGRAR
jgi:hypothetical protein